ncbi:zinc-dependent metalloprotease [Kordia sp.]|uniref:zinc-dependent metalloprotease n=1 Tax=Kordia sp. TaxID=1965332 RepID=UPI003B5A8AC3
MKATLFKKYTYAFLFLFSLSCFSQKTLFDTSAMQKNAQSKQSIEVSKNYAKKENVRTSYTNFSINSDIFNADKVVFKIDGKTFSAFLLEKNVRGEDDFTWFGKTDEGFGIFFTVKNGRVASKFSVGDYSYTLVPLKRNGEHILIEFRDTNVGRCGNERDSYPRDEGPIRLEDERGLAKNDNDCTLRVLLATTPTARTEIAAAGFDLPTFAQVMVDEANLAYITSQIGITMELGVLIETNYTESLGNSHQTDVARFRNGTNGLNIAHTYRNIYQTDLQVLIRRNEPGIFGIVFDIPLGNSYNQANGYATVAVDGVTDGRFSFTHEVGHLQGARHDNHNANPSYGRGFVSGTGTNAWRTIMARTAAAPCNQANSCRIGSFSNPNINGPGGVASGNNGRNNARRLNESANSINAYRQVPTNLFLQSETIQDNYVSNHLAKTRIDTNNNNIYYQDESVGTMRASEEIVLRPGTFIEQGADFRAYTVNDPCENPAFLRQANTDGGRIERIESNELELTLYPNPSSNTINVRLSETLQNFTVEIYDYQSNARVFVNDYKEIAENEVTIDVSNFKTGIYILRLSGEGNTVITSKFVKK